MFDWNDNGEVKDTIWGEFSEAEDHIVPYSKGSEDNILLTFGDHYKNPRNKQAGRDVIYIDQKTSGAKDDLSVSNLQNGSHVSSNEEISAPRFDLDSWSDLPSLNTSMCNGYSDRDDQDQMASELVNNLSKAPSLDPLSDNMITKICHADIHHKIDPSSLKQSCSFSTVGTVQLDSDSDMFGNEHGDREVESFLDCDWSNIADFDDLDRIFRSNDFIFGHEMIGSSDELLSQSTDAISATTPSLPMIDIPRYLDGPAEKDGSSFQVDEQSAGNIKFLQEDKPADNSLVDGEQGGCQSHLTSENCGIHGQFSSKVDKEKKLKSRKKADEKGKEKFPRSSTNDWSRNHSQVQPSEILKTHAPVPPILQSFPSATSYQPREIGAPESMGYFPPSSQHMLAGYGYPLQSFPAVTLHPPIHAERKCHPSVATGYKVHPYPSKQTSSSKKLPDVLSRPMNMTPQEKIEKLRRRQQMQAMLAIQQQQQQFSQQIAGADMPVSQKSSQMNQHQDAIDSTITFQENAKGEPSENMPVEQDDYKISISHNDYSLGEAMLHQLQEVIEKLDISVRLCIRDSLFRLAKSAMERQCTSDGNSANKSSGNEDEVLVDEETNNQDRSTKSTDVETDTNPIDRTVAYLLFHSPPESCTVSIKAEIPEFLVSSNPVSKQSNNLETLSADKPESAEDMEVQASL